MAMRRLRPNGLVVWQDVPDAELVLLHPGTGIYYGLNATGARCWRGLAAAPSTAAELASTVSTTCGVTRQRAETDVEHLVAALRAADLITDAGAGVQG